MADRTDSPMTHWEVVEWYENNPPGVMQVGAWNNITRGYDYAHWIDTEDED